jgi:hypothetical protein
MRQTISGLVAAIAVVTASAVPALACGGGLFSSSCSPCGQTYVEPCAQPQVYVPPAPVYSGCNTGCGGWGYERLADPDTQYGYGAAPAQHQYYYVNQGPTYTGPGDFAPYPTYHETSVSGWSAYHRHHRHHYGYGGLEAPRVYGYGAHHYRHWHTHSYRYGYEPRTGYTPHFYTTHHHNMRYGMPMGMPYHYGYREHTLRRYY